MKQLLIFLTSVFLVSQANAQYVYTIKADSVKLTACDSTELIIENHTQGISGFLYNKVNGRTEFRRGLIKLNDSSYLVGADTLKVGGPQYWAANGSHIYNLNTGNVGIRRHQPVTTLDLPGAINIDDTSSYQINYHPMLCVGDLEGSVYMSLFLGDSSGKNTTGVLSTHVGGMAGYNSEGDYNTNVGANAGANETSQPDFGAFNTNLGAYAGSGSNGGLNTYIGMGAGTQYNGSYNTVTGVWGGGNPIIGDFNSFYGASAGLTYTGGGESNCLFGYQTGQNFTGSHNVFIGNNTGTDITGSNNVFIGEQPLNVSNPNFVVDGNTVLGANSFIQQSTSCTALGSGVSIAGVNSTAIGSNFGLGASNTMAFGNGSVQSWLFGLSTPASGKALIVGTGSSNGNGAYLTSGGVWTNASDRNKKENFRTLDDNEILAKINQLPVTRWNYKGLAEQHIGPVAQDFHRIFDVGSDDKAISTIDPSGIALAGIQGLYRKWQFAETKVAAQAVQISDQQSEIQLLKAKLEKQEDVTQKILEKLNSLETAIGQKTARKGDVAQSR